MKETVLPASSATSTGCPGRIARGHDVDGVRHGVVHLHHQFTEAAVHAMADRLIGVISAIGPLRTSLPVFGS